MEKYDFGLQSMLGVSKRFFYEESGLMWAHQRMKETSTKVHERFENISYLTLVIGSILVGYKEFSNLAKEINHKNQSIESKVTQYNPKN